jgi:hypothetical protein
VCASGRSCLLPIEVSVLRAPSLKGNSVRHMLHLSLEAHDGTKDFEDLHIAKVVCVMVPSCWNIICGGD